MKLEDRMEKIEQDLERIERQTAFTISREFHEKLYKNGYYHIVSLPSNEPTTNHRIQVQVLNDRIRISLDVSDNYRITQYDMYFE